MRLWMDDDQRVLTDEQLLQPIAYKGSLEAAVADGNIHLVTADSTQTPSAAKPKPNNDGNRRTLADYLQEG